MNVLFYSGAFNPGQPRLHPILSIVVDGRLLHLGVFGFPLILIAYSLIGHQQPFPFRTLAS